MEEDNSFLVRALAQQEGILAEQERVLRNTRLRGTGDFNEWVIVNSTKKKKKINKYHSLDKNMIDIIRKKISDYILDSILSDEYISDNKVRKYIMERYFHVYNNNGKEITNEEYCDAFNYLLQYLGYRRCKVSNEHNITISFKSSTEFAVNNLSIDTKNKSVERNYSSSGAELSMPFDVLSVLERYDYKSKCDSKLFMLDISKYVKENMKSINDTDGSMELFTEDFLNIIVNVSNINIFIPIILKEVVYTYEKLNKIVSYMNSATDNAYSGFSKYVAHRFHSNEIQEILSSLGDTDITEKSFWKAFDYGLLELQEPINNLIKKNLPTKIKNILVQEKEKEVKKKTGVKNNTIDYSTYNYVPSPIEPLFSTDI